MKKKTKKNHFNKDHLPINFSAGPALLPRSVLQSIYSEWFDWYEGMSILELSHRCEPVMAMHEQVLILLRELLELPSDFTILMMHGGGRGQFSAVPLNLLKQKNQAFYLLTGFWGELAASACERYASVTKMPINIQDSLPIFSTEDFQNMAYAHYTDNETIAGIEFRQQPKIPNIPVVCDMTSSLLGKVLQWDHLDCVYASAQKNLGIAGCTFVIIRKSLLGDAHPLTPDILNYKAYAESNSLFNTPPVFAWYVSLKVLEWVKNQGGVASMEDLAKNRSDKLYQFIDKSSLYQNTVPAPWRSTMNVPFLIKNHESDFFPEARKVGLYFLEGHRNVGGARASMYNAMPLEGVDRLIEFMTNFEEKYC
ncbi:MAG TPA: 3-phosphoserine/phosphohydroxythreonine transaminase [Gammaproteobacteria bacterium]|nr:3-phosphoserine/phosphohydroxythreonine transaminase [Gammaproteobacteria bacterium]